MATSKTATAPAKGATKKTAAFDGITAYCVKTKEKNVPMLNAVIDLSNGKYIAKGVDADGNKLTAITSKANAEKWIAEGHAAPGVGLAPAKKATKK